VFLKSNFKGTVDDSNFNLNGTIDKMGSTIKYTVFIYFFFLLYGSVLLN